MKKSKTFFSGILFAGVMAGSMPTLAKVEIKYSTQEESKKPSIEKVLYSSDAIKDSELSHVTLFGLVEESQKEALNKKDEYLKSWKRFTIGQTTLFGVAAAAFMKNYINDDSIAAFKKRAVVQEVIKKANDLGPMKLKIGAFLSLAAIGIYPLIKYYKFFDLSDIGYFFPAEPVDDVVLIRKRVFSHMVYTQNGAYPVYKMQDLPVGYMLPDEYKKEFKVVCQANRRMHVTYVNAILCAGGLIWAALLK